MAFISKAVDNMVAIILFCLYNKLKDLVIPLDGFIHKWSQEVRIRTRGRNDISPGFF